MRTTPRHYYNEVSSVLFDASGSRWEIEHLRQALGNALRIIPRYLPQAFTRRIVIRVNSREMDLIDKEIIEEGDPVQPVLVYRNILLNSGKRINARKEYFSRLISVDYAVVEPTEFIVRNMNLIDYKRAESQFFNSGGQTQIDSYVYKEETPTVVYFSSVGREMHEVYAHATLIPILYESANVETDPAKFGEYYYRRRDGILERSREEGGTYEKSNVNPQDQTNTYGDDDEYFAVYDSYAPIIKNYMLSFLFGMNTSGASVDLARFHLEMFHQEIIGQQEGAYRTLNQENPNLVLGGSRN